MAPHFQKHLNHLIKLHLNLRDIYLFLFAGMPTLIRDGGVLHSKLLVSDRRHFYLGSANLSDRGLTKTKEMGILVTHCPSLADDVAKIFGK